MSKKVSPQETTTDLLRKSEQKISSILASITDCHFELDKKWRFICINDHAMEYFNRKREELIGLSYFDVFPTLKGSIFKQQYRKAVSKSLSVHFDVESILYPGRWIELHVYPTEERGVSVFFRDITESKRAEIALRESEERFRAIADYSYDCENWFDSNGKLIWVNPAVYRLTGYTVDECMAMTDFPVPLFDREDRERLVSHLGQATRGSSANDVEFRIRCKDGSQKWVAASWQPIYDGNGYSLGHRSSIRDISDRKRAEEKIQMLNEELKQNVMKLETANKDLKILNYSVSHELKTSLVGIQGFSRRLLEKYANRFDEKGEQYLRRINASSMQMIKTLTDLLIFFSFGPRKIGSSDIKMDKIVREVADELKETHPERTIKWNINTLPDAKGDKTMFRQVFANLLSNAVKFSKPRKTTVIEVGGWTEDEKNVYYVKDNGIGFSIDNVNRIFEVFERLHTSEEFEGTGVGLAIVKRVINRHGGEVWVNSKVDEGTTFYFSISR